MAKFYEVTLKREIGGAEDILAALQIRNDVDDGKIKDWIVSRQRTSNFSFVKPDEWVEKDELQSFEKKLKDKWPEGLKRDKTSDMMLQICLQINFQTSYGSLKDYDGNNLLYSFIVNHNFASSFAIRKSEKS